MRHHFQYEARHRPLLPISQFANRVIAHLLVAIFATVFSLSIGTAGYCYFGRLSFVDGLYNASMILTGMGPVTEMTTTASKLFASTYAIYSGVAFISTVAVVLTPVVHRIFHAFNLPEE